MSAAFVRRYGTSLQVVVGFAPFIVAVMLTSHLMRQAPSPQQACNEKCGSMGKQGRLIYDGPATPKSLYKELHGSCLCE
jgi:hypothetical protein